MSNKYLYQFELSWSYSRSPWHEEYFALAVSEEGAFLECIIDDKPFTVPLAGKVDALCDALERAFRHLNTIHFVNHCVLDGAGWYVNFHTNNDESGASGSNYYPEEFREFMEFLHELCDLPWSKIRREFDTKALTKEQFEKCVTMELPMNLSSPEPHPAPEEGPDGVDRWTSNGYGIHSVTKKTDKE